MYENQKIRGKHRITEGDDIYAVKHTQRDSYKRKDFPLNGVTSTFVKISNDEGTFYDLNL